MAEIFPDCESKKLQEFIENAANVNTKKKRPLCGQQFGRRGLKKNGSVWIL